MIEKDDIMISKADHLHLHIIGYPKQGESIVVNIGNKFVGVIDCFKKGNCFKTKEIVEKYGGKIDFLCWTHTDWDHTYGISELKDYFYDETAIIVPGAFQAKEWRTLVLDNTTVENYKLKEYNEIFKIIDNTKDYLYQGVNESTELYNFRLLNGSKVIEFGMKSFAPMGKIMRDLEKEYLKGATDKKEKREKQFEKYNHDNNLFSVGLVITLRVYGGILKIVLTGDLENKVIESMHPKSVERVFSRANIIKIPHHGSVSARSLIDFEYPNGIKFDYAITTSYQDKLPEEAVLSEYSKYGKVINVNYNDKDIYGIAEYEVPLLDPVENIDKLQILHRRGNADHYTSKICR